MENEQQQDQQGLPGNNSALPSSANCPAGPFLVPQASLQEFQLGLGGFPPQPPQSFGQQVNPYLTAGLPQLSANLGSYASIASTTGLQGFQQLLHSLPAFTIPPGPPSEENAATASTAAAVPLGTAARSLPSVSRGRQQSVPAVRSQSPSVSRRSSPARRRKRAKV